VRLLGPVKRWLALIDARGAAAVEFAIVGSSFMLMLLAAFEFGYMLFVQSVLDNAARDAARLIRTGQVQQSSNPTSTFQTLLCNDVGSLIGSGNIIYQSQVFLRRRTLSTRRRRGMSTAISLAQGSVPALPNRSSR
jgi:Flp pilus assembly protein TadG